MLRGDLDRRELPEVGVPMSCAVAEGAGAAGIGGKAAGAGCGLCGGVRDRDRDLAESKLSCRP